MDLDDVVPWGRSLDEYRTLFALTDVDLAGRLLGCGDGPASVNAELTAAGGHIVSCDPLYAFTGDEIAARVDQASATMLPLLEDTRDDYVWAHFTDPADLHRHRLATMRRFCADLETGRAEGRYVTAALPHLPFRDSTFDLALCSHLLFLYSEQLSYDLHLASALELLRVAGEVRIFPLLDLRCERSAHLDPLQADLERAGIEVAIVPVDYEFQRGADEMLRLRRPSP
jgi:hypothetical protein